MFPVPSSAPLVEPPFPGYGAQHPPGQPAQPWPVGDRPATVGVVAAHAGAGASTLALALAEAAAAATQVGVVQVSEWCAPHRSGLLSAATSELGVSNDGVWRRGTRARVVLDRAAGWTRPAGWPAPPGPVLLHVADLGCVDAAHLPAGAPELVVCRATVPGLRQLEYLLCTVTQPVVAVALIGPTRLPPVVAASTGPRTRTAADAGLVVTVPMDRRLARDGVTSAPIPRPVAAAADGLLTLVRDHRPVHPLRAGYPVRHDLGAAGSGGVGDSASPNEGLDGTQLGFDERGPVSDVAF